MALKPVGREFVLMAAGRDGFEASWSRTEGESSSEEVQEREGSDEGVQGCWLIGRFHLQGHGFVDRWHGGSCADCLGRVQVCRPCSCG
ncbi:hypothetical protein O6H91_01G130300 [Diphasiastrum complanatum]|uniref:Uncharacterized protein n=1 Tax=Diphasiastrum complanatum TaxID=34168 RepID=A0ACC2EVZ3_DIPCM|nr:hypothetical protein O6H91_01G130300 [Diphasiastrum complanatum]